MAQALLEACEKVTSDQDSLLASSEQLVESYLAVMWQENGYKKDSIFH